MGIERVQTDAAKSFNLRRKDQDDCSLSQAETDTTFLIDNRTPPTSAASKAAAAAADRPKKTHVIRVELSNVLPENDSSFEVQYENALVISHDNGVDSELDESFEVSDESAIEVICV